MKQRMMPLLAALLVLLPAQPALADNISDGQWYHRLLSTAEAHKITQGDGIIVAVIDTGVDASHSDLAGSVLPGTDFTGDQSDGRVDVDGHGTAMASLIAAHGRVKGVAPAVKVLPIRASKVDSSGTSKIADGIRWAISRQVKVISISSGGPRDLLIQQEVQAAIAADIVVVAGAGNLPKDTSVRFPAALPGVVAVGGVDQAGNHHSSVSVSGPEMAIVAPSDNLSTAVPGGKHQVNAGTSGATAIVAGAVALVRAKFPQMKAPEVIRRLTATAIDKGTPGRDPDYGFGVLNIVGALTADLPAATSAPAAKPSSAVAAPPGEPSRFPWWVLFFAVPIVAAASIGIVLLTRRREG